MGFNVRHKCVPLNKVIRLHTFMFAKHEMLIILYNKQQNLTFNNTNVNVDD